MSTNRLKNCLLINATQKEELRLAVVANNMLDELLVHRYNQNQTKGNIYLGEVTRVEPSLGAVFVKYKDSAYGETRHGFLPLKEISKDYYQNTDKLTDNDRPSVRNLIREGQPLIVQVDKEERGQKGAALTTYISLAGCYLVLMPNNPRAGGISRRIEGEERESLKDNLDRLNLPEGMGVIVRTAGLGRSYEELQWDLNILLKQWETIKEAAAQKKPPFLIYQESNIVIRAIRDYLRHDTDEVIVDKPEIHQEFIDVLEKFRPEFVSKVKLYQDSVPLFSHYKIESQIESAFQREVRLPSGGSIVIDHTEALVAIDINSAKATSGEGIEETALQTNLEASDEIARQLRLRDIGGLVVIDFIDMTPPRHHTYVENRLREALRTDRARVQIGRISRFGLLEMSRQRLRPSLDESSYITCPRCEGFGSIRSVESLTLSVLRLVEETALQAKSNTIQLQVPVEIAAYLTNEKRKKVQELEEENNLRVVIIPNPYFEIPKFEIKCVQSTQGSQASYKMIEQPKVEIPIFEKQAERMEEVPAVQTVLPNVPPPAASMTPVQKKQPSLLKRVLASLFGSDVEEAPKPRRNDRSHHQHGNRRSRYNRRQTPRQPGASNLPLELLPSEKSERQPKHERHNERQRHSHRRDGEHRNKHTQRNPSTHPSRGHEKIQAPAPIMAEQEERNEKAYTQAPATSVEKVMPQTSSYTETRETKVEFAVEKAPVLKEIEAVEAVAPEDHQSNYFSEYPKALPVTQTKNPVYEESSQNQTAITTDDSSSSEVEVMAEPKPQTDNSGQPRPYRHPKRAHRHKHYRRRYGQRQGTESNESPAFQDDED